MSNLAHITRRRLLWYLLPVSGACFSRGVTSETVQPRLAGGQIRVSAPRLHFVAGNALERLQNGAPVPFAIQFTFSTDRWATVSQRDIERFVFSYDLWEQRYSIAKLGLPHKSVSNLTAHAAEAWCIDEMTVPAAGISEQQPFWLRLDIRADNPSEDRQVMTDEGISLTRLVELFSRRARSGDNRWSVEAGPFRLASLDRPGVLR
jgi:hypothetical protein